MFMVNWEYCIINNDIYSLVHTKWDCKYTYNILYLVFS